MENNQNHIEEMIKEAFANHEMEVSSKVWAGVQSTLASQATATVATGGLLAKAAAFIGITTLVAIGSINEYRLATKSETVTPTTIEQVGIEPSSASYDSDIVAIDDKAIEAIEPIETKKAGITLPSAENKVTKAEKVQSIANSSTQPAKAVASASTAKNKEPNEPELASGNQKPEGTPEPEIKVAKTKNDRKEKQDDSTGDQASKSTPSNVEPTADEIQQKCSVRFTHEAKTFISPDGDGTNDCFEARDAENVAHFHIRIWTRSGELVFESSDINFQWCGSNQSKGGEMLENRTICFYQIDAVDGQGMVYTERNARGSIMVVH